MVHIMDDQGFGRFAPIIPVDVPTGWECPRCRRVYSPQTGQCVPCSPPPQSFAGSLPRPKTGLFGFDLAPGTPILKVPVDEPDPEPRRHEYTFGGFPEAGAESPPRHPMCKCTLTPCPPPAEGGMCGCDEPDNDPASFRPRGPEKPNPRTATPPAYLAGGPNGVRLVRLTGDWAEIFTGIQARFLDEGRIQADIEFRIAPADGETGD